MRTYPILLALAFLVAGSSVALAQALNDDSGPAELPPASYTGTQYVDSKGCVYIRAGYAGKVNWVPRVSRDRTVMCGFKPTMAATAPVPAPAPQQPASVSVAPKPVQTVAAPKPAAPVVVIPVAPAVAATVTPPAPVAKPVANVAPAATKPAAPLRLTVTAAAVAPARFSVPKGYVVAWKDDRLNPRRGQGTATGQAQMDMVWTREVPARLVAGAAKAGLTQPYAVPARPTMRVSTKTPSANTAVPRPAAPAQGANYLQVGSFGVPSNASTTAARLQAMGLPVQVRPAVIRGKPLQIVLAGPFGDPDRLGRALAAVRGAGFRDAFVRR